MTNTTIISSDQLQPPTYEGVVDEFDLTLLKQGANLVVEDGSIAVTKWGDLRMGSVAYNALWRLVQHWRFSAPATKQLFSAVYSMRDRIHALAGRQNLTARIDPTDYSRQDYWDDRHRTNEDIASLSYGHRTYAGCLIVALSGLLQQFRDDVGATADDWNKIGPMFQTCSFGQVMIAASNSFRHMDEWIKVRGSPNTKQQAASMGVLEPALGRKLKGPNSSIIEICPDALHLMSGGGSFDCLNANFFHFAHAVAERIDDSPPKI
jgi:hypothetical protein